MRDGVRKVSRYAVIVMFCVQILVFGSFAAAAKETEENLQFLQMVCPYLTDETFGLDRWELHDTNLVEFQKKNLEFVKVLFPRMTEELLKQPDAQARQDGVREQQKRLEAMKKLSGGTVFSIWSKKGLLFVVPKRDPDPEAEAAVVSLMEDFPFYEPTNEKDARILELQKKMVVVKPTEEAVLFFISTPSFLAFLREVMPDVELPFPETVLSREADLEMLEEHLKSSIKRSDFETMLSRENFGKAQTLILALPPGIREILKVQVADVNYEEGAMKGISGADMMQVADSFLGVSVLRDSFYDPGMVRFEFETEDEAALAHRIFGNLFANARDAFKERSGNEMASAADDWMDLLTLAFAPKLQGNALTLDWQENFDAVGDRYLGFMKRLGEFQNAQREALERTDDEEAERICTLLKPWLTLQTTFVARVDLDRITPDLWMNAGLEEFAKMAPNFFQSAEGRDVLKAADEAVELVKLHLEKLRKTGAKDVFLFVDLSNLLIPVRVVIPGMKLEGNGLTEGVHAGTLYSLEEFAANCTDMPLSSLPEETKNQVCVGKWNDSVILLMKTQEDLADLDVWNSFVDTHHASELENVEAAQKYCVNSALSLTFRMTPVLAMAIQSILEAQKTAFRNNEIDPPFYIPPAKILTNGLDVVTLSADPNLGTFSLNIFGKSEKSARNLLKLIELWHEDALDAMQTAQAERLSMDPNIQEQDLLLLMAASEDWIDWIFEFARPMRDGKRLYWDWSQSERISQLPKLSPENKMFLTAGPIAVGTALLIPAVRQAREAARQMQASNNFKQCVLAALNFESAMEHYPTAYSVDADGKPLHSWRVHILPYLGEMELHEKIRLDEPWDSEWNRQFHDQCPQVYRSVRDPGDPRAVIGVVVGEGCIFEPVTKPDQKGCALEEVLDGLSNTVLFVPCEPVCWMDPTANVPFEKAREKEIPAEFSGGFHAAMADGCVYIFRPELLDTDGWRSLLLRDDGEVITPDIMIEKGSSAEADETEDTEAENETDAAESDMLLVPEPVALPMPEGI